MCREIVNYHNSSILYKKGFRLCPLLKVIGVCTAPSRMILVLSDTCGFGAIAI